MNENPQGPGRGRGGGAGGDFRGGIIGEEGQVDVIIVMRKVTWLETILIQGGHVSLTAKPMGTQLKTAHN